jgi:hypothetical protein
MTLDQLFKYLNFISTKENSGLTYTPVLFNLNLPIVVRDVYDNYFREYENTGVISDVLSAYLVSMDDNSAPLMIGANGLANKPEDYYHKDSMNYKIDYDGGVTEFRPVEVLTSALFNYRKGSKLREPNNRYPICRFLDTVIEFLPKDLQYVDFTYLRSPESPIYDYYINSSGDVVFMPEGTQHYLSTGEEGSQGQTTFLTGGEVFTVGLSTEGFPLAPIVDQYHYFTDKAVTYGGNTNQTWKFGTDWTVPAIAPAYDIRNYVDSLTVEMIMPDKAHLMIARQMLADIGINLRDQQLLQYAELLKAQSNANKN